ncbi:carboxypeptidase regulatory-like domain-containing protein [Dactylosporangium aurantiacum]|uniref:Carboxypeptidase regulatory-like domain-containing protein n=1 Tax=Dactylosporangium aurantiacum TaxID=35754 RepID=A0A9Q9MIP9_9ACTN|nr:carboxypeptidase-like regulatory domain-containing protein [Dactylosporangium aurantiacum]MDG6108350.1 carboxypeptidase regulatory-like domain-containing protein [Dactylosporangium aurantiacum]UWZ53891.1 carboxypeptidase regulatory-like domain-containing protein [Dactylosporangium aurantiacum]
MRKHGLRRALLHAAVTAATIAGAAVSTTPAYAETGTSVITGHLADANGNPAVGADVWAQTWNMSTPAATTTDANGAYTLPDLPAGEYQVSYRASGGSFTQWAHQKLTYADSDVIIVGAGATVVVDDRLLPTATISGSLLNRDGTPAWAYLTVFDSAAQNYITSVSVPSSGAFTLELPVGSYKLNYRVRDAFDQWSGGKTSYETAVPVEVIAGQAVQVVETVLPTGSVGGQLTNADGSPAANVGVIANQPDGNGSQGWTTTGADGRYRIDDLLLGVYVVAFAGPAGVTQYAHGRLDSAAADRFTVTDGKLTTVDETFLPTGAIRIVAHDATTGEPLENFCVWATNTDNVRGCATGVELLIADLFVGTYTLNVNIDDHLHLTVPYVPVTVAAGQTATIDVAMRQGASITATMVSRDGGIAVNGCVGVANISQPYGYDPYGFCSDERPGPTPGSVVIGPLEPGTYQLLADPRSDTLGLQWVGAAGGTGDRDAAQRFTVASGDRITAPTIQFDRAGTVRGKVTDVNTGAPVARVCVSVVALSQGFAPQGGCGFWTGADGTYSIPGVGPYAWPVQFIERGYQWRWSGNAVNRHEATMVTVPAGKYAAANIKLRTGGGTLTGTVHDAAGNPRNAFVVAYDALSGEALHSGDSNNQYSNPPMTFTIPNIAPQQIKIFYQLPDGRSGWLGGADLAHAQTYQIRNNRTLTVDVIVP